MICLVRKLFDYNYICSAVDRKINSSPINLKPRYRYKWNMIFSISNKMNNIHFMVGI
jgi:hypothetical protein